jgi:excisionase family DNA binding protein
LEVAAAGGDDARPQYISHRGLLSRTDSMPRSRATAQERLGPQEARSEASSRPGVLVPLLTLHEVAAFLRLNSRTVRRLTAAGKLPSVRVCGRLRYEADALVRFVQARKG